ncbi:TCR alpha V3 [Pelobates cultripes]|nr:TCR alpha V3 [Pelobates cultripes]
MEMFNTLLFYVFLSSVFLSFVSGEKVTQSPPEVTSGEGTQAMFFCSTDVTASSMYWYIQKPGQVPRLLFRDFTKEEDLDEEVKGRLSYKYDRTKNQFPLNITKVRIADAGTYYCAMNPTLYKKHKEDVQ